MSGGDGLRPASLLRAVPVLLLSGSAWSAPQDIDFGLDCTQLPPHVFKAKVGAAVDSRIELLNSKGERRFDGEVCPHFRTLKSVTTTRTADSEHLRFDVAYRYRVRAFDRAGNASEFSIISLVQTPVEGPPGHPH